MAELGHWNIDDGAVWREILDGQTISLRHPSYPAECAWDGDDTKLQAIAVGYLRKVAGTLGLPDLLKANGEFKKPLAWLPPVDLTRYENARERKHLLDRTMVFHASQSWTAGNKDRLLRSRLGLRIVAHIERGGRGRKGNVRIIGAARSMVLAGALAPRDHEIEVLRNFLSDPTQLINLVRSASGLGDLIVSYDGVRILEASSQRASFEIYATLPRSAEESLDPHRPAEAVTARAVWTKDGKPEVKNVERFALLAHARPGTRARLFLRDPASIAGTGCIVQARPNRAPHLLEPFRHPVTLEGIELDPTGRTELKDDLRLVEVRKSKLADRTANEGLAEIGQPSAVAIARMDSFAALSGYQYTRSTFDEHHARPLFETIAAYGLPPEDYFQCAAQPLLVRYRAGMLRGPGEDGKIVNAEVDFDPPGGSKNLKPLQVRFALADLRRSVSRREPLGLAVDSRWAWHEYAHVLLAAQTGALELPFVHSVGDALAAIAADPHSNLAGSPALRYFTFPWVYLSRRHDRSVFRGWSWSGRYHRQGRFDKVGGAHRRKGYNSEQILSTSLFRLYQALGGNTVFANGTPDRDVRQRAADYTLSLILRAIRLLPPVSSNLVETPDQLVTFLMAADTGTWPATGGPLQGIAGGWAHKVVRWAFEAQGLYATNNTADVVDAPGKPPRVDVFIENNRPDVAGDFDRGGYAPVSLDWDTTRWQAHPDAIEIRNNRVSVWVRNRGSAAATRVKVRVWCMDLPRNQTPAPLWDPASWSGGGEWRYLTESKAQSVPAWPNPGKKFGSFRLPRRPANTQRLILAAASCAADRANIDPATSLPCSAKPAPIVDLVAGDNNLGLLRLA